MVGRFLALFVLMVGLENAHASSRPSFLPDTGLKNPFWAYDVLHIPHRSVKEPDEVIVAVVDDGFRLSHASLKGSIYKNIKEIPGNKRDDDNNGYVDDIHGWDISDHDADVSLPKGKEGTFYHGTYVASIVSEVFRRCYGAPNRSKLQIMPIKVLSDDAKTTYLADGYKGIKYAIDNGAHIICCAWSGSTLSVEQKTILEEAIKKGVIVIGSAGNFYSEKVEFPAQYPDLLAVAAVDTSLYKTASSNFGMRVDISLPGFGVRAASSFSDTAWTYQEGTSPAVALAAGCVASLKAAFPKLENEVLIDALKNTSLPVDFKNLSFAGKLGSGVPDLEKAFWFLENPSKRNTCFHPERTKGKIYLEKGKSRTYALSPPGNYQGFWFFLPTKNKKAAKSEIQLWGGGTRIFEGSLDRLKEGINVPGASAKIVFTTPIQETTEIAYFVETIDSTTLYCKGTTTHDLPEGIITDGSGPSTYANKVDCKWLITLPPGKKIQIECLELDTEPNQDLVYIFDGPSTIQQNLVAIFSGTTLPPRITSRSNQLLIWFVTNPAVAGKGWKIKYTTVD